MRIRLLIDIEIDDISRLVKYTGEQPPVHLETADGWDVWGRFVGAKEAETGLDDMALKDPYDRQAERDKRT